MIWALRIGLAVALLAAAGEAVRLGWADYLGRKKTYEGLTRASELAPENSWNYAQLGRMLAASDQAKSAAAFKKAVERNPWDSASWIELGLWAESAGDLGAADRYLNEAARVDALYGPRWTLANFYYRRGDLEKFWRWSREAARMGYGNLSPLFRLAAQAAGEDRDASTLLGLEGPAAIANYLYFAVASKRAHEVVSCGLRLAGSGRPDARPAVLLATDYLLGELRVEDALRVWRAACVSGVAPLRAEEADGGRVTNGDFARAPLGGGFDWRLAGVTGVEAGSDARERAIRISLSGSQPEHCVLLWQIVPVKAAGSYEVRAEYRTSGLVKESGVAWRVEDAASGKDLTESREWLSSEEWGEVTSRGEIPAGVKLVRVVLGYDRAPGTVRREGWVSVRTVSLVSL